MIQTSYVPFIWDPCEGCRRAVCHARTRARTEGRTFPTDT